MNKIKHIAIVIWLALSAMTIGCSDKHKDGDEAHYHDLMDRISQANDSITYQVTSNDFIENMERIQVQIEGYSTFMVPDRAASMELFPCSSCHDRPIDQLVNKGTHKNSHWDISLQHAPSETMNCFTCHDRDNLDQLISITSQPISFSNSYNLCGQCHSTQKKEWLGGGHGKRIGGWAPPRTSMTCVNCHNPHSPSFEKRWPARLNKTKILQQENE